MVMQIQTNKLKLGVALTAMLLGLTCLVAQPAQASMRDQAVTGRLSDQRDVLLNKEKRLLQDYDELQRLIRDSQREHSDGRLVDQLCRQSDLKYEDLQAVR